MGQLVNDLNLNATQHNREIDKAKDKVHRYKEEADKAGQSIEDMGSKQTRSAKELLDAMKGVEGSARSVTNYRSQLAAITRQIQDLTINYRAMSAEMQSSDFGREVADKITELTARAGEYKDAILDAQASIKTLSSDTANWDAMKQGIDVVSSSLQAFVSTGALGKNTTEKLISVLAKLKAMEVATSAVIKAGNALQKQSALMMGIQRVQALALAKAKNMEAAATGKCVIAQRLFNTVAKSNPYILLASVIITLVGALALFSKRSKDVVKAGKEESEALKAAREEAERYKSSLASTTSNILSKYKVLQIEYSKLRTDHEKTQWIQKNKTEFEQLGIKVKNLKDAEDAFKNNTASVVEALKKRAKAMANQNRLTQLFELMMQEELRASENYAKQAKKVGDKYYGDITQQNRHMFQMDNSGNWVYNAKGVEEENKKIKASCFALVDDWQKKIDSTAAQIAGELDMSTILGSGSGGSGGGGITVKADPESLAAAQKAVSDLQEKLNNMSPNNEKFEETKQKLVEAQKEVERIQKLLNNTTETEPEIGSLVAAQKLVSDLQEKLNKMAPDNANFEETKKNLEEAKAEVERIQNLLDNKKQYAPFSIKDIQDKISKLQEELDSLDWSTNEFREVAKELKVWQDVLKNIESFATNINNDLSDTKEFINAMTAAFDDAQFNYNIGLIDRGQAEEIIDNINKEFKKRNLTIEYTLELKQTGLDKGLEKFDSVKNKVGDVVSSFSNAYDSITGLGDRLDEETDGIKKFFMVWETGMSIINSATTTLQTLAPIINAITTATELSAAAKTKEAAASAANTTANEAESASVMKTAIAKMMEAVAGGAKAVASIPYVGPVLAIAAAAAITASLISAFSKSKTQKFSRGGIFKGTSSVNDKNYARLNDGEMVLNTQQQKKLFQMLNSNGVLDRNSDSGNAGGEVHFVIEGDKLVGTLNNYNRKISHSRR